MTSAKDDSPLAPSRERGGDRDHKISQIGIWAGLCGGIASGSLVAVGTSAPLFSATVAAFVLRWTVVIGLSAVLLATVYWRVR